MVSGFCHTLLLCSLPQCSTEWCCGAMCSQRRTGGLSRGPEFLYPCGATGSRAPFSPQVVPWLSRFQSRQSRCTRHRSKRLPLVTAALTLPRPLPAEQVLVTTFCLPAFLTTAENDPHQRASCLLPAHFPSSGQLYPSLSDSFPGMFIPVASSCATLYLSRCCWA